MKKILLFLLLLIPMQSTAQNYSCFVPGAYQYFINQITYPGFFSLNGGYLRGMHIDSLKQDTDKTIYYPFHTLRGLWDNTGHQSITLDSNGGSWLGKDVVRLADGIFVFNNYWGDTVFIKTQANIGETWMFYDDSTTEHFTATLMGTDTMTILGALDSVKAIKIVQYDSGAINTLAGTMNILLSKNHGFAQVFDLYMFPFHPVDTIDRSLLDYYTGLSLRNGGKIFKQISFHNPTEAEINEHSIGDVLEGEVNQFVDWYYIDTIVGKVIYADSTKYYFNSAHIIPGPGQNSIGFGTNSLVVTNKQYFDSTFMPESFENLYNNTVYYWPNDTAWCLKGDAFEIMSNLIYFTGSGYSVYTGLGACGYVNMFKEGLGDQLFLGLVYATYCINDESKESRLYYAYKQGIGSCGQFRDLLGISEISKTAQFDVYPNPASTMLSVKVSGVHYYDLAIVNIMGQQLYSIHSNKNMEVIEVDRFTPGLYSIIITDEFGNRTNKKVIIAH